MILGDQLSAVSSTKKMPDFVQRSAGDLHKPLVVEKTSSSVTFRQIGSDTVCCTNELFADCFLGEIFPIRSHFPNGIREQFGPLVHPQFFEL